MKAQEQLNIKFAPQEFEIIQILKKKYAINISQFIKNCIMLKYKELKKNDIDL